MVLYDSKIRIMDMLQCGVNTSRDLSVDTRIVVSRALKQSLIRKKKSESGREIEEYCYWI